MSILGKVFGNLDDEIQTALEQPSSGERQYALEKSKIVQTAYLMVCGIILDEGLNSVIDVLERADKSHFEQKTVVANGYCDNSVRMREYYLFLPENGALSTATNRFKRQQFVDYVMHLAAEEDADSAAEQLREQIDSGQLVRLYHIEDSDGEWTRDAEISEFVKNLDKLRLLYLKELIGRSTRKGSGAVMIPFVPVYGLDKFYNEKHYAEFVEAHARRIRRREFADYYFKLEGVTPNVWNDNVWDKDDVFLVKDGSGQLTPAISNDKEVRPAEEGDVTSWADPLLVNPAKGYPHLEKPTFQSLVNYLAKLNPWDRIKAFRRLYEQMIMSFAVAQKSIQEAHPGDWEKYMLLPEIAKRMPPIIRNYILYKMELTEKQSYNLFHPDNIPYKYRRMLAHRFGKEQVKSFLEHFVKNELPNSVRHFVAEKEKTEPLSEEQQSLLVNFIAFVQEESKSFDAEEYCKQRAEKIKQEKGDPKESTEKKTEPEKKPEERADEDATEEEKNDEKRGGDGADEETVDDAEIRLVMQSMDRVSEKKFKQVTEALNKRKKDGKPKRKGSTGNDKK